MLAQCANAATYLEAVDSMEDGEFEDLDERLNNARWIEDLAPADQDFVRRCLDDLKAGRDSDWYEEHVLGIGGGPPDDE